MRLRWLTLLFATAALLGCSTPYRPPVVVHGGPDFPGLVDILGKSADAAIDVVLVHGMCTHDEVWANDAIDMLVRAVDSNLKPDRPKSLSRPTRAEGIQVVDRTVAMAGGTVRFSALVWSPLTTPLKQQLAYDSTGEPKDCAAPGECKPTRASLNGKLKDGLMNDCLSDAMIYQGQSRRAIRAQMMEAIGDIVDQSKSGPAAGARGTVPLVLVSESLGSKLAFDALAEMIDPGGPAPRKAIGDSAVERLGLVFMGANQLPILGLADQDIASSDKGLEAVAPGPQDSLQKLLRLKADQKTTKAAALTKMSLVAFTDPNDLLSYRLQPSRYATPEVGVTDVLVSNDTTYFGFLERPDIAHRGYRDNADVAALIACGRPRSPRCK